MWPPVNWARVLFDQLAYWSLGKDPLIPDTLTEPARVDRWLDKPGERLQAELSAEPLEDEWPTCPECGEATATAGRRCAFCRLGLSPTKLPEPVEDVA